MFRPSLLFADNSKSTHPNGKICCTDVHEKVAATPLLKLGDYKNEIEVAIGNG